MYIRTFLTAFSVLFLSAPLVRAEVLVFAAASLKEPVDVMAAQFPDVTVSYAGSGTLARQLTQGAPADVILLANADWMDVLVAGGHVQTQTVNDFASNSLVLIGAQGAREIALTFDAMNAALGDGRIAVGMTEAVPAGIYAKAALIDLGLWTPFATRLAEVDNVRAALALVARGQAPLGIVYATDARISQNVSVLASFPTGSHDPIRYTGAVVSPTDDAAAFWHFVQGPQGQAILAQAGFQPPVAQ